MNFNGLINLKFERAQAHVIQYTYTLYSFGQLKWPSQFIRMNYEPDKQYLYTCAAITLSTMYDQYEKNMGT